MWSPETSGLRLIRPPFTYTPLSLPRSSTHHTSSTLYNLACRRVTVDCSTRIAQPSTRPITIGLSASTTSRALPFDQNRIFDVTLAHYARPAADSRRNGSSPLVPSASISVCLRYTCRPTDPSRRSPTTCSSRKGLRVSSTTAAARTPTTHGTTVSWRAADSCTSRTAARSRSTRSTKGLSMCRATPLDRPTREQATIRALNALGPSRPRTSFHALGVNVGRMSVG